MPDDFKFFMADKSRSKANGGVGLGLSLCAEIAKIHDAKIEIESKLNKGTIIKLIFNHKEVSRDFPRLF